MPALFWMELYFERKPEQPLADTAEAVKKYLKDVERMNISDIKTIRAIETKGHQFKASCEFDTDNGRKKVDLQPIISSHHILNRKAIEISLTIPENFVGGLDGERVTEEHAKENLAKFLGLGERFYAHFKCFYGWADEEHNSVDFSSEPIEKKSEKWAKNMFLFLSKPIIEQLGASRVEEYPYRELSDGGKLINAFYTGNLMHYDLKDWDFFK